MPAPPLDGTRCRALRRLERLGRHLPNPRSHDHTPPATTQLTVGLGMKRPYTTVNAAEHAYLPEAEPGFPWRTDKEPGSYGVPVRPTGIFTQALLPPLELPTLPVESRVSCARGRRPARRRSCSLT